MSFKNSQGKIYYGMHFYPGVAEYQEPGKDPYRVYLNENTIRSMDPSFAGKPIFVDHVDEVSPKLDEVKKVADGWVIESFFNAADGKHWVKFILTSERAEKAVRNGMRLSNAYLPKGFGVAGLWNGVSYEKEITSGVYEHLALVNSPRYEESVIKTPEEFKKYNEDHLVELKRLSNSKEEKGESKMAFKIFKKTKVENAIDPDLTIVLPKSGREISITQLVNEMDESEEMKKKNEVPADMTHQVKLHDGSMCNVGELLEKHKAMHDELEDMKKMKKDEMEPETEVSEKDEGVDSESSPEMKNEEEEKKKKLMIDEEKEKEVEAAKKKNALEKAAKLKNAHLKNVEHDEEVATVELLTDQVARGRARYGSGS